MCINRSKYRCFRSVFMRVETERMYFYPLSDEEMRLVIEKESDPEMKQAYTEML